jgi:hypothetical protein
MHITKISAQIDPANVGRVHHILLYECPEILTSDRPSYDGICYTGSDMPSYVRTCNGGRTVAGWAVGGEPLIFPAEAGYPVGGSNAPRSFLMETHYDMRPGIPAFVDSSGLRLDMTRTLRPNDAGIMMMGHEVTPTMEIPPERSHFEHRGWCTAECSAAKLAGDNITVFGVILHGHLTARRISARHFRGDTELEPLAVDEHYDFNYQQVTPVLPHRVVRSGDSLLTSCVYDSSARQAVTRGGLSTSDEMVSFVFLSFFGARVIVLRPF